MALFEKDGKFFSDDPNPYGHDGPTEVTREQFIESGQRPSDITQDEVEWARSVDTYHRDIDKLSELEKRDGVPAGTYSNKADVRPEYPGSNAAGTGVQNTPTNPNPTVNQTLDHLDPTTVKIQPFSSAVPTTVRTSRVTAPNPVNSSALDGSFGDLSSAKKNLDYLDDGSSTDTGTVSDTEAPTVDTTAVDSVMSDVDAMRAYIFGQANQKKDYSAAEAQLRIATDQAQRHALGQARAGNRRDRGLLERQATSEGAAVEQQAGRDTALLRAQEEDQDRRFSTDAAAKAAELGLNEAAYRVDIGKTDVASANNLINDKFTQLGIDKQLDVASTQNVLAFTQAMAGIQLEYDKLSVEDQNAADALLMQQYGIDQGTMVALKQLQQASGMNWGQFFTTLVAGGVQGGTMALGAKLF